MSRLNTIIISFLVIFLMGFFLILPQQRAFKDINSRLQEKKAELGYKKEYFSNVRKLSEELEKYESEIFKIDSALPAEPFLPSLFNFLAKTSSQNGLILKNIGQFRIAVSEKEQSRIKEINLEITVTGFYPAFKNFLSTLEKTARLIEVENISFARQEKSESFDFGLKIKTHSY